MKKYIRPLNTIKPESGVQVPKEILEAYLFLIIRYGYKGVILLHPSDGGILTGTEKYKSAIDAGAEEIEAIEFDSDTPGLEELSEYNRKPDGESLIAERGYVPREEFQRDPEHVAHMPDRDDNDFDDTEESYKKYGKLQPLYYIEFIRDGKRIKSVIDGWKFVRFAKRNGIDKIFAYKLNIGNNDDLLSIMALLQRSNHSDMMALYRLCEALWPKYFRGQGYRSDMADDELVKITSEHNGRRKNIYEKIVSVINLPANTVKFLLKVRRVNPLHFGRIEKSRFTLYHAYLECVAEEKGILTSIPVAKTPRIIKDMTKPPVFSEGTTTDPVTFSDPTTTDSNQTGDTGNVRYDNDDDLTSDSKATNGTNTDGTGHCHPNNREDTKPATGVIISQDERGLIAEVTCPFCGNTFSVKIKK
jgi:hypothetical protein